MQRFSVSNRTGIQWRVRLVCATGVILTYCLHVSPRAYGQEQKPPDCIYAMNADGTDARKIYELPGFPNLGSLAVSPDGRHIAFDAWQEGESSGGGRVFIMSRDGSELIELSSALMPTWSPDGQFLAVSRNAPYGAWIMAIDGSSSERIANGWGAQWSPDGKWVAYTVGTDIMLYEVATGRERNIFPSNLHSYRQIYWNMAWSPDSDRLCFLGELDENRVIATVAIDDPEDSHKVHHSEPQRRIWADFAWHPDGNRIVVSMRDPEIKRHQLYEFNPAAEDPPVLVEGQPPRRSNQDVTWTRDGAELIFISK